jgi:hypothetical protein
MPWDIDAMRALVGWRSDTRVDEVERRHTRDYLRAVGASDAHPAIGELVPPVLVACYLQEPPRLPGVERFGSHWLNGTDRFEVREPIWVGDTLESVTTLTAAELKQGRAGPLGVLTFVTEFSRPGAGPVVVHTGTRLRR